VKLIIQFLFFFVSTNMSVVLYLKA
jgi:hypothetical protein